MANKFEAHLENPLSYAELVEIMNAMHEREKGLKEAISGNSQFEVSDNVLRVKLANTQLVKSKFQRLLWKVQEKG